MGAPNSFARPFQTPLLTKKRQVEGIVNQLRTRMQEIAEQRKRIELNATRDYEEIVGRLRAEEAAKLSVLQQQIDTHTATVSRIEAIENTLMVHGRGTVPTLAESPEYLRLYPDIQQLLRETAPMRTVTKHLHDETSARAQKLKAF